MSKMSHEKATSQHQATEKNHRSTASTQPKDDRKQDHSMKNAGQSDDAHRASKDEHGKSTSKSGNKA